MKYVYGLSLLMFVVVICAWVVHTENTGLEEIERPNSNSYTLEMVYTLEKKFEKDLEMLANTKSQKRSYDNQQLIDVYWHVITSNTGKGFITKANIEKQLEIANKHYAPEFKFRLYLVDYTRNDQLFNLSIDDDSKVFSYFRKGGIADLNVFTVNTTAENSWVTLGWARLPGQVVGTDFSHLDGVVLSYQVIPPSTLFDRQQGLIFVHEVGHWLGLYHTFQGGCSKDLNRTKYPQYQGDMINDTVAEDSPASGCPIGRKSCENMWWVDPIHNFMDYASDECMLRKDPQGQFTDDQRMRMANQWKTFRSHCSRPTNWCTGPGDVFRTFACNNSLPPALTCVFRSEPRYGVIQKQSDGTCVETRRDTNVDCTRLFRAKGDCTAIPDAMLSQTSPDGRTVSYDCDNDGFLDLAYFDNTKHKVFFSSNSPPCFGRDDNGLGDNFCPGVFKRPHCPKPKGWCGSRFTNFFTRRVFLRHDCDRDSIPDLVCREKHQVRLMRSSDYCEEQVIPFSEPDTLSARCPGIGFVR